MEEAKEIINKLEMEEYSIRELKQLIKDLLELIPLKVSSLKEIKERDNNKCRLCGSNEGLEVHHITPRFLGGDNNANNLITICKVCHSFLHCNPRGKTNKTELVKKAVVRKDGVAFSYKGNKWGRKAIKIDDKIIELHKQGKSIRDICKEVYYWDKSNNKKFVSIGYVHSILTSVPKLSE